MIMIMTRMIILGNRNDDDDNVAIIMFNYAVSDSDNETVYQCDHYKKPIYCTAY